MPSNFDNVIGQHRVKDILRNSIRNERLAHAYLFWGNEGVGKDALAIEFARTLLCERGGESACGECASCKKMQTLHHPNVKLLFPLPGGDSEKNDDGEKMENDVMDEVLRQTAEKAADPYFHISIPKAKFIRISSVRGLKKESSLSSAESGKKVFLIFDADAMNDPSANSLLKILEEPLEGTYFILTSSRKDQVKQTIISRCQLIQCSTLNDEEISTALCQRDGIDEEQAHFIAHLANGSYRRAKELLGEDINKYRADAVKFLRSILGNSALKLFEEQDEYVSTNKREHVEQLLQMMLVWFRDVFVLRDGGGEFILNSDQKSDLKSFVAKFGTQNIEYCLSAIERALELLRRNVYLPLVMLSLTVQLRRILNAK